MSMRSVHECGMHPNKRNIAPIVASMDCLDDDLVRMIVAYVDFDYLVKSINTYWRNLVDKPKTITKTSKVIESVSLLQWARSEGCAWNANTCAFAAENGHLHVLQAST